MKGADKSDRKFNHDAYARTRSETDFWGQIRRTVNGAAVPDDQIRLIVQLIRRGLNFSPNDVLLDLACGNGALAARFYRDCSAYLGVDSSDYLITIADRYFAIEPDYLFRLQDVDSYVDTETDAQRYTKALCYGSFPYFSIDTAQHLLMRLAQSFNNLETLYIGNIPDRDKWREFYTRQSPHPGELDDHESQIGIWWSREAFADLVARAGWKSEFISLPESHYASHYRYDVRLTALKDDA